jgi:hypothetical protein
MILVGFCCFMPLSIGPGNHNEIDLLADIFTGFSPGVVMFHLHFFEFEDREIYHASRDVPFLIWGILGVGLWVGFSFLLSFGTIRRFRRLANRIPEKPRLGPLRSERRRSNEEREAREERSPDRPRRSRDRPPRPRRRDDPDMEP